MRLLLDTHALLWWAVNDPQLSRRVYKALKSSDADVYVSAASAWEIATKVRLGKLAWPAEAGTINAYVLGQSFRPLPVSIEHAERAGALSVEHRDPFDRMLIAQASAEGLLLASNEKLFDGFGVSRLW